jgi:putative phosphonate catabolism associated alcohol dehydrogenase
MALGRMAYMDEPGKLSIREFDIPERIDDGAVLLEVVQTNVCGSEIHIFGGHHPVLKSGGLGHEMIGRVACLGAGVTADCAGTPIAVGDRVVPVYTLCCMRCRACNRGHYSHCEHAFDWFGRQDVAPHFHGATYASHYYLHPGQYFYRVPDSVPAGEAASANCALAQVLVAIDVAGVKPGQTVVVQGAGGLGLNACAVAKERGATVVAIDGVAARLDLAREFGADHIVNLREHNDPAGRVALIRELTDGWGADVAIEVTGVPGSVPEGVEMLGVGGWYALIGNINLGETCTFDPAAVVRKLVTMRGFNRYPPHYLHEALRFLERTRHRFPFGKLLDKSFSLENTKEAIEASARREVARATIIP